MSHILCPSCKSETSPGERCSFCGTALPKPMAFSFLSSYVDEPEEKPAPTKASLPAIPVAPVAPAVQPAVQLVRITDIQIPFGTMVDLAIKWFFASVLAALLVGAILFAIGLLISFILALLGIAISIPR